MTSTTQSLLLVGAVLTSSVAGFACQKTAEEAHTDNVEAQQKADEKVAEANAKAGDTVAESHREVAAESADARKTAAEAQAAANEKIRDNNRAMIDDKEGARNWGQKEVDSVDTMIDEASVKAQTAAPKAKAGFKTAMVEVKQQRDVLHSELATLDKPAGDKLDASKQHFSERADRIKDNIRNIEKSL